MVSRFFAFAVVFVVASSASAQSAERVERVFGQVVSGIDGSPIAGSVVRLHESETRARTDESGRFSLLLPRDGAHYLAVTAETFGRGGVDFVRAGEDVTVELFPAQHDEANVARWLAYKDHRDESAPQFRVTLVPEHDGPGSATFAETAPRVPDTIRVWRARRTPLEPTRANGFADRSCEGTVEEIPFEEYVKGVVPSEWIPSWHQESLRAGAIAARSYAFRHVQRGGRWDCADVDDGSVTQVYKDSRSDGATAAVEHTRGQLVMRSGALVFAEYSAENGHPTRDEVNDPVCRGTDLFGHGRGMCQNGSHRWASGRCATDPCDYDGFDAAPKDYVWIVEHYYPAASVAGGALDEPCLPLGPSGGVLDEKGACFASFGPARYWRQEPRGHEGSLLWTNAFSDPEPSNWARWSVNMEDPGRYTIEVYLEAGFETYAAVRYEVEHAGGVSEVIIDQNVSGWQKLGEYELDGENEVRLLDNYEGEVAPDQKILADAVRVTPAAGTVPDAGPEPDAGLDDAGMDDAGSEDAGTEDAGVDGGRENPDDEGGCSCRVARTSDAAPLALMVFALLLRRRRD